MENEKELVDLINQIKQENPETREFDDSKAKAAAKAKGIEKMLNEFEAELVLKGKKLEKLKENPTVKKYLAYVNVFNYYNSEVIQLSKSLEIAKKEIECEEHLLFWSEQRIEGVRSFDSSISTRLDCLLCGKHIEDSDNNGPNYEHIIRYMPNDNWRIEKDKLQSILSTISIELRNSGFSVMDIKLALIKYEQTIRQNVKVNKITKKA
jgi:hypothetical protein